MADKKSGGSGTSKRKLALAAALIGQKGGLRGGPARARALSAERRSEISAMGALAAKKGRKKS